MLKFMYQMISTNRKTTAAKFRIHRSYNSRQLFCFPHLPSLNPKKSNRGSTVNEILNQAGKTILGIDVGSTSHIC